MVPYGLVSSVWGGPFSVIPEDKDPAILGTTPNKPPCGFRGEVVEVKHVFGKQMVLYSGLHD